MKHTEDEIEEMILKHVEIGQQMAELKKEDDKLKAVYTDWLNNIGASSVNAPGFTAKLNTRKGAVNWKAIQTTHGILDSELDATRAPSNTYWTVKKK